MSYDMLLHMFTQFNSRKEVHPQDEAEDINIVHEREQGAQMLELINIDQLHIHNTVMEAVQTTSQQNWQWCGTS